MRRRTRLARQLFGAGATDQQYSIALRDKLNQVKNLITPANLLPEPNPNYIGLVMAYNVSDAFLDLDMRVSLVFVAYTAMPHAMGMLTTYDNIPAIILRTSFPSLKDKREGDLKPLIEMHGSLEDTLIHELAHLLQKYKHNQPIKNPERANYQGDREWLHDYYREPSESDAYFIQSVEPMWYAYSLSIRIFQSYIKRAREEGVETLDGQSLTWAETPEQQEQLAKVLARNQYFGKSPTEFVWRVKQAIGERWYDAPNDVRRRWIRRATQFYNHVLELEKNAA